MNELLLSRLLSAITFRRAINILKTGSSFFLSSLLQKPIIWGFPPILTIEPANICNLRCPLCATGSGEMKRTKGKMTPDTFQLLMDKIGNDILFLLIYHQGEPYINEHFFDFVKIAKSKKIYVTTSTNGHYFSEQNIQKTLTCGLDSMIVSIDGVTQESYARYRVKGNLQKVIEGTEKLIIERNKQGSRTPNVAIQFLVMKHNEHQIKQMQQLTKEIGADRLLIKNIEVRSYREALTWLPENKSFRRYDLTGNDFIVKGIADKKSCTRPWLSTLVNWDGTFVPCCFDKNAHYPMGNINSEKSIEQIWRGTLFQNFRRQLVTDRKQIDICRNCNQGFGFLPAKIIKRQTKGNNPKTDSDQLPFVD